MSDFFDSAACARLVLTLGHFLWQGLAAGALASVAGTVLQRASSSARYRINLAALAVMAACPVVTYVWLGGDVSPAESAATAVVTTTPQQAPAQSDSVPVRLSLPVAQTGGDGGHEGTVEPPTPPDATSGTAAAPDVGGTHWRRFAPWVAAAYLAGVLVMSVRLALGLRGGRRLRRRSEAVTEGELPGLLAQRAAALGLRSVPALAWCREVAVPTVVGVVRPAILLPVTLTTGLTHEQLAGVLTHELAHIRRWDPLVNVLQRGVEAALFFHPMVWFVSGRIRREREHCCDDLVLATGADPLGYASSLLDVAERAAERRRRGVALLAALRADGRSSELGGRIRRLLGGEPHEAVRLNRPGLALGAAVAAAVLVGLGRLAATGEADEREAAENPARVTLPNGVVVELVGVAVDPWGDERWWRADGASLAEVPRVEGRTSAAADEDSFVRTFVIQASGLPADAVYRTEVTPSRHGATGSGREAFGPLQVHATKVMPDNVETATVRFDFAAGEWEDVLSLDARGKPQGDAAPPGRGIAFVRLDPGEDGAELVLRLPDEAERWGIEYRVQAVDEDGAEHGASGTQTSRQGAGPTELTQRYRLRPEQIRGLRVQAVRYRYQVTFRNVALRPGQRTEVEVDVEAPERIGRNEFAEVVAVRVVNRLPLTWDEPRRRTAAEFRELVRKYAPEELSAEFVRPVLESLDRHTAREFPEGPDAADPVVRDRHYINLPAAVRMLQWRLFTALSRRPLDDEDLARRAEQHEWIREQIRSLSRAPESFERAGRTRDGAVAELQAVFDDPLDPLFQEPLTEEQFAAFRRSVREHIERLGDRALIHAVARIVQAAMEVRYGNDVKIPAPELESFGERPGGYSTSNGNIQVQFPSPEAFRGMANVISDYREPGSFMSLSGPSPSLLSLGVAGTPGQGATLEDLDRWFVDREGRGHVIFDEEVMRLIGVRGTRILPLTERRFFEADRLSAVSLIGRVEAEGTRFWELPVPVSHDEAIGRSVYDGMAAMLTPEGRLYLLQLQEHDEAGLKFHVRRHHPQQAGGPSLPEVAGRRRTPVVWPERIRGVVRDAAGGVIPRAEVELRLQVQERGVGGIVERTLHRAGTTTDADGRYAFDPADFPMPTGRPFVVTVSADAPGHAAWRNWIWYGLGEEDVRAEMPPLVMPRGRAVRGQVVGADGRPVAGAVLTGLDAFANGGWAVRPFETDAEGRFECVVPDGGPAALRVVSRDWAPQFVSLPDDARGPLRVSLERGTAVAGTLLSRSGRPVAGALVVAESDDGGPLPGHYLPIRLATKTSRDGGFRFPPLRGVHRILVAAAAVSHDRTRDELIASDRLGLHVAPQWVDFGMESRESLTLREAGVARVSGAVRDSSGAPIPRAVVRFHLMPAGNGVGVDLGETVTDDAGRFRHAVPTPLADVHVRVESIGAKYVGKPSVRLEPVSADVPDVDLRVEP